MEHKNSFALGSLGLDSNVNPFGNGGPTSNIYRFGPLVTSNNGHNGAQKSLNIGQYDHPVSQTNALSSSAVNSDQYQHPIVASQIQATQTMALWLELNHLGLVAQIAQQGNNSTNMGTLPSNESIQVPSILANFVPPAPPIAPSYGNISKKLKNWNLNLTQQIAAVNHELLSLQATIDHPKHRLVAQERHRDHQHDCSAASTSGLSYTTSHNFNQFRKRFATRPYEPALIVPSPTKSTSPQSAFGLLSTPTRRQTPPVPQQRSGKRHHRTATPEQRQIRALTNGAPIYTLGIDPQTDRGLLCDFFEQIKTWSTTYTVHIRSLSAEQVHNLAAHGTIAECLGQPSQLAMLVTEKDMLTAMISGVVSRFIFARTLGDHAMYLSGHSHANLCEQLAYEWTMLPANENDKKNELLGYQREIYTSIKTAYDHKTWRTTCAQQFTSQLLFKLDGLLNSPLTPSAAAERTHVLQELFVKGYRIGFRLRMASAKWDFQWPVAGAVYDATTMVNESRMLYGDIMSTMREVMSNPGEHVVRFAVSPTVVKNDYSVGGEEREVVHSALVQITRKGWL